MLSIGMTMIGEKKDSFLFEAIYKKYRARVYSIAFRVLKNSALAEEAAADAFFNIARSFDSIKLLEAHKLEYYIAVTAKNAALDILKKEKKYMDDVEYNDEINFTDDNIGKYDYSFLKECIRKLSEQDREILYLRFNCSLDYTTISHSIGVSAAAARKRVQYAKEHLRVLLEGQG